MHTINIPVASPAHMSVSVTFAQEPTIEGSIQFVGQTRDCSASNKCGRCEGHCQNNRECQGSLVCFKKGGRGKPVPGCIGIDGSKTDWCTVDASSPDTPIPPTPSPQTPTLPIEGSIPLVGQTRDCSASDKCGRCEGHCQNNRECQGSLVCFKKGGRGKPVPGCIGNDGSRTDWCTEADF